MNFQRKKKVTSQKKKPTVEGIDSQQPKRKRGRPPKAENVQVLPPPPPLPPKGVGVFKSDKDGFFYFSTSKETIKVSSQPVGGNSRSAKPNVVKHSSSQP